MMTPENITDDVRRMAFEAWRAGALQFRVDLLLAETLGHAARAPGHEYAYRTTHADQLKQFGWIYLARTTLNISGAKVAERAGLARGNYFRLEKNELGGNVTLASMKKAAEAMGCEFVYGIRPQTGTFSETVWHQLSDRAEKEFLRMRFGRPFTGPPFGKAHSVCVRFLALEEDTKVRRSLLWNQRLAVRRLPNSFTSGH